MSVDKELKAVGDAIKHLEVSLRGRDLTPKQRATIRGFSFELQAIYVKSLLKDNNKVVHPFNCECEDCTSPRQFGGIRP